MKKFFISLFITIIPIIVFITLYRAVNNVNGYFDLELIFNYLCDFTPFENFTELIDYVDNSFSTISSDLIEINNISIDSILDFLTKIWEYIKWFFSLSFNIIMWVVELIQCLFDSVLDTINFVLDFFDFILKI